MKIWTDETARKVFRQWLLWRDDFTYQVCRRVDRTGSWLEVSHFIRRSFKSVRYWPDNCHIFCKWCHAKWEHKKAEAYRDWVRLKIGQPRFLNLLIEGQRIVKLRAAIEEFQKWYNAGVESGKWERFKT